MQELACPRGHFLLHVLIGVVQSMPGEWWLVRQPEGLQSRDCMHVHMQAGLPE